MDGAASVKTVIAEDVEIVGSVKSSSDIHLAGKLSGDLTCNGSAIIGETANIKGNISADSTSVSGQVTGNISVKDRIELKATARLNGDIRAKRLTVEDGVTFVGKSEVNPSGSPTRPTGETKSPAAENVDSGEEQAEEVRSRQGIFGKK